MPNRKNQESDQSEIKADWKDFIALVIAAYSILLPPLFIIIGAAALMMVVLYLVF